MIKWMYPGTFDPITLGHLDIIERAARMVDVLCIAIMENNTKRCDFSPVERKIYIEKACAHIPNVRVYIGEGLTAEYAKKLECCALVRGIRAVVDYEYELALATSNMRIYPDLETLLLVSKPEYSFLSSSIAKEVARYDGDISGFLPQVICQDVKQRLKNKDI